MFKFDIMKNTRVNNISRVYSAISSAGIIPGPTLTL